MVPYAGKDDEDVPFSRHARRVTTENLPTDPWPRRRRKVYDLFRMGYDTAALSDRFKVKEYTILRWINIERAAAKSLPNPYEATK
jgi:hypothetical protein